MSTKNSIKDGTGSQRELKIDKNHSAIVTTTVIPPEENSVVLKPFSTLMDNSGTTDMRVVGSLASPVDFVISSSTEGNRHIHTLAFTIADAAASLNQFGNLPALTNGCQLIYQDDTLGDVVIAEALKTNFDFVQLCNFEPTFGTGTAAFLASNVSGASEAYIPILDIEDVFGIPYGLSLPKASTKKIILRIRDDVSGVDRFDSRAYGFDRINI